MCGITAFLGFRPALDILVTGLQRLEYRGYDSAGVAIVEQDDAGASLYVCKRKGKVRNLAGAARQSQGMCGIAHTRWATHGPPNDVNSHPHVSYSGHIALVHNGIIENFLDLRRFIESRGIEFQSETDTEVLVHLIELARSGSLTGAGPSPGAPIPLHKAVAIALSQVDGTFGIACVDSREPGVLVGARKGSPLLLGVGPRQAEHGDQCEYYLASDASAIVEHTKSVVYLEEGDIVRVTNEGYGVFNLADILKLLSRVRDPNLSVGSRSNVASPSVDATEGHFPASSHLPRVDSFSRRSATAARIMQVSIDQEDRAVGRHIVVPDHLVEAVDEDETSGQGVLRDVVARKDIKLRKLGSKEISRPVHQLEISLAEIEKGGFKHFMLKEIMDQPRTLENCMRGRVAMDAATGDATVQLGGLQGLSKRAIIGVRAAGTLARRGFAHALSRTCPSSAGGRCATDAGASAFGRRHQPECVAFLLHASRALVSHRTAGAAMAEPVDQLLSRARRIIIASCGTSWHAGLVGEYLLENLAGVSVEVEYASEFIYRNPILYPDQDVLLVISQSGETADTLQAIRMAKAQGVLAIGICNVVGSSIARETDSGIYLHAGPEIGVASTKAFTAQIVVLVMLALRLGFLNGRISQAELNRHVAALLRIPAQVQTVLTEWKETIAGRAREYRFASNFLYMGRGYNFPVALEGALKLTELSYQHAQGYPAAEMKHGPIALIDNFMPVAFIAPKSDKTYDKIRSNVEEVRARKGSLLMVTEEGNPDFDDVCDFVVKVPVTLECLSPILSVIPLQLLAYHIADLRGCDVDQPRNLAKSVTVE